MILVDTNVFAIDLRYPHDRLAATNRAFLDRLAVHGDGATTLYNVLELAGILSFNLSPRQLQDLVATFAPRYRIRVLPALDRALGLPTPTVGALLERMARRCALGDAQVLAAAEQVADREAAFVSWDAERFVGRTALRVATPAEWLASDGLAAP